MMIFSDSDIAQMPQRYRANFINCLSGFKSANLVGTQNQDGQTNLAIVSSVFHVGANPPLLGMIMRPHTVPRDTLQNIKDSGVYTLNAVPVAHVEAAHQTSARYDESEFTAVGLTPHYTSTLNAPYVAESPLRIGLELAQREVIELNQTELVIGRVVEVFVDNNIITNDGYIDIEQLQIATISGLDTYHKTTKINRFSYAKPNEPLEKL
jgi:flavin reductase (DIM6/NTAB) family NADH-FMN oxidoreductase RutF